MKVKDVREATRRSWTLLVPIVRAEDKLLRLRRRDVFFHPTTRACDTVEQKRFEDITELHKLVRSYRQFIPSEVLAVIEPLPPIGARPADAPRPSMVEQTQRAFAGPASELAPWADGTRDLRDGAIIQALGIQQDAGMLHMDEHLAAAVEAKLNEGPLGGHARGARRSGV